MVSHTFTCHIFLFLAVVLGLGQILGNHIDSPEVSSADEISLDVETNDVGDELSGSEDGGQELLEDSEDILSLDEFSKSPAAQEMKKEEEEVNSESHLEEDREFHEYFPPFYPGDSEFTKNPGPGDGDQELLENSEEILSLDEYSKSPAGLVNQDEESLHVDTHLEDDWELSKYLPPLYPIGDSEFTENFGNSMKNFRDSELLKNMRKTGSKAVDVENEELYNHNGLFHGMLGYEQYYPYSHESSYIKSVHDNVVEFAKVRSEIETESKKLSEEVEEVFTRLTGLMEGTIAKLFEADKILRDGIRSEKRGRAEELRNVRSDLMQAQYILMSEVDAVNQAIESHEVVVDLMKDQEAKALRDKKAKSLTQKEKGGDVIGKTFEMIKTLAKLPLMTGFESASVETAMQIPKLAISIKEMVDAFKGGDILGADDFGEAFKAKIPDLEDMKSKLFQDSKAGVESLVPKIPNVRQKRDTSSYQNDEL